MLAIRNTVRQMFAMATRLTIKAALLRACGKQPPQPTPQRAPDAETPSTRELYVAEDDPEEAFAEWEADRNEKLHRVQDYEQRGLELLGKAALLRSALQCDDRGETLLAEELREQAEAMDHQSITEVLSDTWERPFLDATRATDVATKGLPASPGA